MSPELVKVLVKKITDQAIACYRATGKIPNVAYVDRRVWYDVVNYCKVPQLHMEFNDIPKPLDKVELDPMYTGRIHCFLKIKVYYAESIYDCDSVYVTKED